MSRYVKLFWATGIPFGLCMGVFYSLGFGFPTGVILGLFAGLFFGGFMSLTLGFLHGRLVKRMPSGKSEEAMGVHHVRNIELRVAYDEAFDLCISSLKLIKKCRIRKEDRSHGRIEAKVGMTWKTFGDVISFNICKIGDNRIQVKISSKPAVRTTLVDYGKNLENVEKIVCFLKGLRE